jgi:hypothetical protein
MESMWFEDDCELLIYHITQDLEMLREASRCETFRAYLARVYMFLASVFLDRSHIERGTAFMRRGSYAHAAHA